MLIAATLVEAPGSISSVSRIGLASSKGLPEIILNFEAQLSASAGVGMMFVTQSSYFQCTINIGILPIGELIVMSWTFGS